MRKHFYLVVEHDHDHRVGGVLIYDSRKAKPLKNEVADIIELNKEHGDFEHVGKQVGLGYHDFKNEAEFNDPDTAGDVIHKKIREVDRKWAEQAGVTGTVYDD